MSRNTARRYSARNRGRARPPEFLPSITSLMSRPDYREWWPRQGGNRQPLPAEVIAPWFDWSIFCSNMTRPLSVTRAAFMPQQFDRSAEDLGNAIHLEHVNVQVPDQRLATLFYVTGLGLTRDPYLMVSDTNMWVNVGRSQFHLPAGPAQVLRGHTALVIPGRKALLDRLASVAKKLEGTAFAFREHNDYVEAICPWGNRIRIYEPDAERFGRIALGIPYVEFDVPVGTAKAIAAFYPEMIGIPAEYRNGDGHVARAKVGKDQYLQFRETDAPQPAF